MSADPADLLRTLWNDGSPNTDDADLVPAELQDAIKRAINSQFKLFHYILPSQLLAKLADPQRHTLSLQARSTLPGSFDARMFCRDYITPFDQQNHSVLGGSEDPGVGNIWRAPQMDESWLSVGHRRTKGGQDLVDVLTYAQANPASVERLLRLTLSAVAQRLEQTRIAYPRPNRVSLNDCKKLIATFLLARSGGRRLQITAAALFDVIGQRFHLFDEVITGNINRSDESTGDVADLDCRSADGQTVLSVEVKDRHLRLREAQDTLSSARERGIREILFVIRGQIAPSELAEYEEFQARQFSAGHNVYDIDFDHLLDAVLILLGESGRLVLLETMGLRLDRLGELSDRQAWREQLLRL
jgi:hypothetical protein